MVCVSYLFPWPARGWGTSFECSQRNDDIYMNNMIRTDLTTLQDKGLKKWNHLSYFTMPLSVSFERVWMMFSLQFKVDILATFQRLRAECLAVYAEIAMVVALTRISGSGTSRSQEDESTLSQVGGGVGGNGWMKEVGPLPKLGIL